MRPKSFGLDMSPDNDFLKHFFETFFEHVFEVV